MNARLAALGLLGSTAVAGLLFAPVFGLPALLLPVLVVVVLGYGSTELCLRVPRLEAWRPLVVLVAGLLGIVETTLFSTTIAGLPTGASLQGLSQGLTESWLRTLQSTWPARPDAGQLLFVPLAVLLAVVLGLELLLRLRMPLVALLPSLAVAVLAQAYQALSGGPALLAALGYFAPAGLVLWAARPGGLRLRRPSASAAWAVLPLVVAIAAGAVAFGGLDPAGREPYRLADGHPVPPPQSPVSNPLDEIAGQLADPERPVFSYRSSAPVERWRLVVLTGFDGAGWSAEPKLRRLGAGLEGVPGAPEVSAELRVPPLSGPWLPSQPGLTSVTGAAPLVDPGAGMLFSAAPGGPAEYRMTWSAPEADPDYLGTAPVDAQAPGGLAGVGAAPDDVARLAWTAVHGLRPTFQSALQLQRFLQQNYQLAVGDDLPTGASWPQLRQFLTVSKRGTSQQFAAAYVALARITGIPARLVVGYRGADTAGEHVVRAGDALAWPEVAVAGVGWVPLDPTKSAATSARSSGLAGAAGRAQAKLPPLEKLQPPVPPADTRPEAAAFVSGTGGWPWWIAAAAAPALVLCGLGGVPLAKALRTRRRRRRLGKDAIFGAWAEARDRLRAHGVAYRAGMTPRDLAESAGAALGERVRDPVLRLSGVMDSALWSRFPPSESAVGVAWMEIRELRRALARRPLRRRMRAVFDPRPLFRRSG
ncbi:transglutaminaseTgpA domain-containing protein [Amycolatopsis sp. VS8301801F10]|uniref:transglutaminase family protein n=1 Tax=Amycolatopsis sp. VS8301801F10 TaxID=2652442 RepID=UPI0038FD1C1E